MSRILTMASPTVALPQLETGQLETGKDTRLLSFAQPTDVHQSLTIPNRGIALGVLLSSALWACLILTARELWLVFR